MPTRLRFGANRRSALLKLFARLGQSRRRWTPSVAKPFKHSSSSVAVPSNPFCATVLRYGVSALPSKGSSLAAAMLAVLGCEKFLRCHPQGRTGRDHPGRKIGHAREVYGIIGLLVV